MYPCTKFSVNLENFRIWNQICLPKKMNDKNFERINMKFELTLIRVGFLEVHFGVGGGVKFPPSPPV